MFCLHVNAVNQFQGTLLFFGRCSGDLESRVVFGIARSAAGVSGDRGQLFHQGFETVCG